MEPLPELPDGLFHKFLVEAGHVRPRKAKVKEGWRYVERVPRADHCYLRFESLHKVELDWVVRLLYPSAFVHQPFAFETTMLESHVRPMLHHHVRACGDSSDVFEVLAH